MSKKVKIYDTTLRDGTQAEGISLSKVDKIRIAQQLDKAGIAYIEGGWPGSNPKDIEFFKEAQGLNLSQAKIAAFGSTRRAGNTAEQDHNLATLIEANTPVVTIFGKTWLLHVKEVLKVSGDENLNMISESIAFLKSKGKEVFYDAEHFFDGFKDDKEYAIKTIKAAEQAGADCVILCDTNGGTLPNEIFEIVSYVVSEMKIDVGIHVHNDAGMADANSVMAVLAGAVQVQGTVNGYGERSGNANICTIIPNLQLKTDFECIDKQQLQHMVFLSRFVDESANQKPNERLPFVGESAFAHKGGMHVNAVEKNPITFEHIEPGLVGNKRRVLVSELSGRSNVVLKAKEMGIDFEEGSDLSRDIVLKIKELENQGYEFEAAEGSFELLIKKSQEKYKSFFDVLDFRVIDEKRVSGVVVSEATIKILVDGVQEYTVAEGDGPVNAMDTALRKALVKFYPSIANMQLTDFKVRVLDYKSATAAKVRVLIESADGESVWGTVGVSENIIEASWLALLDSVEYKLLKEWENNKRG